MNNKTREIKNFSKPSKGLYTDSNQINQPPNTYRYALNVTLESDQGDHSAIINEEGTTECFQLQEGFQILGSVFGDNNQNIIFSTDGNVGRIGIQNKKCEYEDLIVSSCLNFDTAYPIQAVFRVRNGCERTLYFTDDFNPIRAINIDNLEQYTTGGIDPDDANNTDQWDCEKFKLNKDYEICSLIKADVRDGGGFLKSGSYFFAVRYLDEEENPTNWFYVSQAVSVGSGNSIDEYTYHGGNELTWSTDLLNENKSIEILISQLDTSFPFYQVAVIELTSGNGVDSNAFLTPKRDITFVQDNFVYTGDRTNLTEYTLDEITIPRVVFNKVKTLQQVDSRLVIGNIEDTPRDWSVFQKASSEIYLNWNTTVSQLRQINGVTTSPKGGQYSFATKGYTRDEIYAFGIVYVFNNGVESPVFHIPGRPADFGIAANSSGVETIYTGADIVNQGNISDHYRNQVPNTLSWDKQILTVKNNVINPQIEISTLAVSHIPSFEFITGDGTDGSTIERWKVFNTAVETTQSTSTDNIRRGLFAYYEVDETYPDITDCSGDSIWGNDIEGNPLEGQNIRHHRMPDTVLSEIRSILPGFRQGGVININVDAKNIVIPADYINEVQGYYLVRSTKDSSNKTVIDKGILCPTGLVTDVSLPSGEARTSGRKLNRFTGTGTEDLQTVTFWSPKSMFYNDQLAPTGYFKFERLIRSTDLDYQLDLDLYLNTVYTSDSAFRTIDGFAYVDKASIAAGAGITVTNQAPINNFPDYLQNQFVTGEQLFVHLQQPMFDPNNVNDEYNYVSLKEWKNPYSNLFNITYIRCKNGIDSGGNSFSNYGGDCFITEPTWKNSITDNVTINTTANQANVFTQFFMESEINTDLRMSGDENWETHLYQFGLPNLTNVTNFLELDQYPEEPNIQVSENFFLINLDFNRQQDFNRYFPLNRNFDYCSECSEDFPNRIWYSERSYQEEIEDKYRSFLSNNYRDLYGTDAELHKLFVYKDELYALTSYATWFIPTRPQQLQTNEGNLFVGTGDVLSIPPKKLQTTDIGYAGSFHPHANTVTEYGASFVDSDAGKVFLLKDGLSEISALGMKNWFINNLPLELLKVIPDFNLITTSHKNGVGFISTFDPRYNRLILSKKDYIPPSSEEIIFGETYESTNINPIVVGYNTSTNEWYTKQGTDPEVILDITQEPEIFEDVSWTMSYSFNHKSWSSFHSYRPNWLWSNRNRFFSYKQDILGNPVWEHGERNFGFNYGNFNPMIVEFIYNNNPVNTKVFNSVNYISNSQLYVDGSWVDQDYITFTNVYFYNSLQSSGILNISEKQTQSNPFVEVNNNIENVYATRNENTWSLNEFYDLTVNNSRAIFINSWFDPDYRNDRIENGNIDYPNVNRSDFNLNSFEVQPFRDKWLGARFWFNNDSNIKLSIEFISDDNNISFK